MERCLTGAGYCLEQLKLMKFRESPYKIFRRLLLGTVPWLAKILKVKALIGASSLNIVEFWQNFNDRFNLDVVI